MGQPESYGTLLAERFSQPARSRSKPTFDGDGQKFVVATAMMMSVCEVGGGSVSGVGGGADVVVGDELPTRDVVGARDLCGRARVLRQRLNVLVEDFAGREIDRQRELSVYYLRQLL